VRVARKTGESRSGCASLQAYSSRWLGIHLIAQQHDDEFDLSFARFNVEQLPGNHMGLRRGFIQAGAQNLLMTLWPISDEVTVQIMSDFYEAAHKSGNAPEALAEVQRDWLVKLRTEKGLAQAVNLAGPFIMSSQGKP
jgi:hypothetical protein